MATPSQLSIAHIRTLLATALKRFVQRRGKWSWRLMRVAAMPLNRLGGTYKRILDDQLVCSHPHRRDLKAFQERIKGLHALLPENPRYTYSVLVPVYRPKGRFLREALESVLSQTAPKMEVLVGLDGPQPQDVQDVLAALQKQHPGVLKSYAIDRKTEGGGISSTTNYLARKATGRFLLLMDHDDWIRPDLLYRYEQTLRLHPDSDRLVLYCDEYKINEKSYPILRSQNKKPRQPLFPYVFHNLICHCLLIPRALWNEVGGLRPETDGAQDFDLALRLDAAGAEFRNVPVYLYAWRAHSQSTARHIGQKDSVIQASLKALSGYAAAKGLDWDIVVGFPANGDTPAAYRAIPRRSSDRPVHVIIPFKDQKEMTLRAVDSVLHQRHKGLKITAVDNRSTDRSIAGELAARNVEVLSIDEPFNYSRLNNLAIARSRHGAPGDLVLFMNNDVELKESALLEMTRWIEQPRIGMVGCRLSFPDGTLQHGGIVINEDIYFGFINWKEIEKLRPEAKLFQARQIHACDAVTAACSMIKREDFEALGGFDEIWHPIAFSDTHLCMKLRARGLLCLYTPYAEAIHYESATRSSSYEDYEASKWLHDQMEQRIHSGQHQ